MFLCCLAGLGDEAVPVGAADVSVGAAGAVDVVEEAGGDVVFDECGVAEGAAPAAELASDFGDGDGGVVVGCGGVFGGWGLHAPVEAVGDGVGEVVEAHLLDDFGGECLGDGVHVNACCVVLLAGVVGVFEFVEDAGVALDYFGGDLAGLLVVLDEVSGDPGGGVEVGAEGGDGEAAEECAGEVSAGETEQVEDEYEDEVGGVHG